jgi:hypothetical protein
LPCFIAFISRSTSLPADGLYLRVELDFFATIFLLAVFLAGDFLAEVFFADFFFVAFVVAMTILPMSRKHGRPKELHYSKLITVLDSFRADDDAAKVQTR